VACHPADIGGAPVNLALFVIEHDFMREGRENEIAAGGVQHALGFAGGAGGVEDKQRVFRLHHFARAIVGLVVYQFVPVNIAVFGPTGFIAGMFKDENFL
jgi:hypothetical protein